MVGRVLPRGTLIKRDIMRISKYLVIIFSIEALTGFLLVSAGILAKNNHLFSMLIILINSLAILYFSIRITNKKEIGLIVIIYSAYLVRMVLAFYDTYMVDLLTLDISAYRASAEYYFLNDIVDFRGHYNPIAHFFGFIYKCFGIQRILLQHFIACMMIIAGLILYLTLSKIGLSYKSKYVALTWMLFSPWTIMQTSTAGREVLVILPVTISLYYFILWFLSEQKKSFFISLISIVIASVFHMGVIAVMIGYICVFLIYKPKYNKFHVACKNIILSALIVFIVIILYNSFGDSFFAGKLRGIESINDIALRGADYGGSGYDLGTRDVDSIGGLLLYSPLRIFYFLFSPFPWQYRNIIDLLAFIFSGFIYLIDIVLAIKVIFNRKIGKKSKKRTLLIALLIVCICSTFVFAWGVSNTGTAIRHRDKFISIFASILAISIDFYEGHSITYKGNRKRERGEFVE
ncbi:MAG: hypothetical protein PHE79_01590 [Eubacteriales bacterium]|nr:hypothetical protein [Eubacteriales bacterium]